ncbi:MAG: IS21 family transposase [Bacteroidales bacterium]
MSQIKQLIHLHQQDKGKKEIARILGMSKNTVKAYLHKLSHCQQSIEDLLMLEDAELETKLHSGNPAYSDDRFEHFKHHLDYYVKELKRTGVTRKLLWEEYRLDHPEGYGLTQFCYHISQHMAAHNPSMVLHHNPGEKLFADFAGKKLSYIDRQTAEVLVCQVFVACMPYSDYSFAMAVKTQNTGDFLYALSICLESLGGVPKVLVPDNLKSAIIKANKYEPGINQALEDFANHYGMAVIPTRSKKPKDKALVENQVKLIYNRVYAKLRNETFFDLDSLNQAIYIKVHNHNQTRMQQKPFSRQECFLASEKPLLSPLPVERFELKYYRQLKVAKNNHIYLGQDKHYYSVPYIHIGAAANVIYTRSMVYIYINRRQVAVHQRNYRPAGYSTQKDHLCSHHRHYLDRSPDYYIEKAKTKSEIFHRLIKAVFDQNRYPEQLYRTCEGYFNLQRNNDTEKFSKACMLALEYKNYSYHFLSNVIKNNTTDQSPTKSQKSLPAHDNIRGRGYYE